MLKTIGVTVVIAGSILAAHGLRPGPIEAQDNASFASSADARSALSRAEAEVRAAGLRAETLEEQAELANESADKARREGAALAARIQQSEAEITAAEARLALIQDQQASLDLSLAERRAPLMQLTAALQRLARRPMALSALRSGSLKDAVYLRAMLATTVPQVEERTRSLRTELEQSRSLARESQTALSALEATESQLAVRRQQLSAREAGQRLASRQAQRAARRESERLFALAEKARDLDSLVSELDRAGELRRSLAALPGPVLRPTRPGASRTETAPRPTPSSAGAPKGYRLPVTGRTLAGFGERASNGTRRTDLLLAPRPGAVVVSPADGRIAFAGPYRGYGRIVIVEHAGGWTSLVTGLARTDAQVGEQVVAGAPIGRATASDPQVTLELRRSGSPVNPLTFVG